MAIGDGYKNLEYWSCLRTFYRMHKNGIHVVWSDLPHLTNDSGVFLKNELSVQADDEEITLERMGPAYLYCAKHAGWEDEDGHVLAYFYKELGIEKKEKLAAKRVAQLKKKHEAAHDKARMRKIQLDHQRAEQHSLDPREYYYERFSEQLKLFAREHLHEHEKGEWYLSLAVLSDENMSHIPVGDQLPFMYCFAFTVLIDQVIYTHFRGAYD